MAVNKVVLGENTLIDLTGDTVSADKLAKGTTAHDMAGEPIVGTMEAGGGIPDNMVTTNTDQTITGNKTFNGGDIVLQGNYGTQGNIILDTSYACIKNHSGNPILTADPNRNHVVVGSNDVTKFQINSKTQPVWFNQSYVTKTLATTDQITTVEANPENPTQTLSSIKIGDVDYSVGGASNIPAPPSTDGEYNLHCSIVNGVPTYSWVAEQQ